MKRLLLIYLLLTTGLFSQEIYKSEYKLVHQFDDIFFEVPDTGGSTKGVDDFAIDNSGNFIFTDQKNNNFVMIDRTFQITNKLDFEPDPFRRKYIVISDLYYSYGHSSAKVYSKDGKIYDLKLPPEYISFRKYQIIEDLIIGEKDGIYYSYQIPETMDDETTFRNQNETFEYLKTRKGFKIDGDFILYNGRLVTTIGETFIEYYHPNKPGDEYSNTTACNLRGIDKDGNYYFGNRKWTYIYDVEGDLFQVVRAKIKSPFTFPKIDPDGNIYYCHLNEDNGTIDLYKIDRVW